MSKPSSQRTGAPSDDRWEVTASHKLAKIYTCLETVLGVDASSTAPVLGLRSYLARRQEGRIRFAVVGSWSSGKSSLVNGILGLEGVEAQATALAECTSIPTVVRPAETTRLLKWEGWRLQLADSVFEEEFNKITPEVMTLFPLIGSYFNKEWEVIREVRRPEEERSVEYLDLPGHMSGERGSQRMKESMVWGVRASDGVIYMVHGEQGLTKEDILFIENSIPDNMPVLMALSHLDGPGKTATDRHAVRDRLENDAFRLLGKNRLIGIMMPTFSEEQSALLPTSNDRNLLKHLKHFTVPAEQPGESATSLNQATADRLVGEVHRTIISFTSSDNACEIKEIIANFETLGKLWPNPKPGVFISRPARLPKKHDPYSLGWFVAKTWGERASGGKWGQYLSHAEYENLRQMRREFMTKHATPNRILNWCEKIEGMKKPDAKCLYLVALAIHYRLASPNCLPSYSLEGYDSLDLLYASATHGIPQAYIILGEKYLQMGGEYYSHGCECLEKARKLGLDVPYKDPRKK